MPTIAAADLELVLALVRGRTLAGAGERLGADASTVFRGLQRLERQLGTRLFERGRQGYQPGDTAQALAAHAERIESELEAARSLTQGAAGHVHGRVRVTTTDSVLRGLVLPVLPALAREHPGLQLELRAGNELANLTQRDADIALRATPKPPEHLVGRALGTIRFVVCASRAMPAAQRRRAWDTLPWAAPDDGMPEHPTVRWRRKAWPKLAPRFLVDGIVAVADAIRSGAAIGAVPLFLQEVESDLVALGPPLEGCQSDLWLLAHPESRHLRRIATVYQHLAQSIRLPD